MTTGTVNLDTASADLAAALINDAIEKHETAVPLTGYGVLHAVLSAMGLVVNSPDDESVDNS